MRMAWPSVPLGDVLAPVVREHQVDPSSEYPLLGVRLDGQGPFHRETVRGTKTSATRLYEVKSGDFIYSRLFAWRGAFGLIEPDLDGYFVSNEFPTFMPKGGRIDPKYLRYWFRLPDVLRRVEADCSGSTPLTRNRYKEQFFFALEIPLPQLDEQHRIVARIEELAAKVDEAWDCRAQATEQRESFTESFIGRRFAELETIHAARSFGSCDAHISSGPRNWGKNYASSGLRFYRAQDIDRDFQINDENVVYVERPSGNQGQSAIVSNGDLLIVITGATVGRVAVYDDTHSPGLVSQHVAVCRIPSVSFLPRFALWGLRGPEGQKQLLGSKYGQGKPGLNLDQIRRLSLPCPPIDVQVKVVAELDALQGRLDAVKILQTETSAELGAMLPAILDKAFRGEMS